MGTTIVFDYTPEFLKSAKILSKRYRSFADDLKNLRDEIIKNPSIGNDLGNGIRKIRMSIMSKRKGKSGGARVITLNLAYEENDLRITFLYVFDKKDMDNISDEKIREIIADNGLK